MNNTDKDIDNINNNNNSGNTSANIKDNISENKNNDINWLNNNTNTEIYSNNASIINNNNNSIVNNNNQENNTNEKLIQDVKNENITKDNSSEAKEKEHKEEKKQDSKKYKENKVIDINEKYIIDLKDYKKIEYIGSGTFGAVYLVENIHTHQKYAAKVSKKKIDESDDILQEIQFYTQFKHPTILSLHGYSMNNFEGQPTPTILLDYMPNKSLAQLFKDKIFMNKNRSIRYIILCGIINAMLYLHHKGIVHRDLKPENILLDEQFYPRVCDFGSSIIYSDTKQHSKVKEKNVGTPLYMAPEIFLLEDSYSYKVDVYAFSMIAYQLLTEIEPFKEKNFGRIGQLKRAVINGVRPDLSIIPDEEIRVFFQRCWSREPSERPSFNEINELFRNNMKIKRIFDVKPERDNFGLFEIEKYNMWFTENFKDEDRIGISMLSNSLFDNENKENIEIYNILKQYEKNKEKLKQLLKQLADKGNKKAMHLYALHLGVGGKLSDQKIVNAYLKKAADLGEDSAMVDYANRLIKGIGITANYKEAARYYKKAADLQNGEGIFNYATLLRNGKGVKKNKKLAATYFQLAADIGEVNGTYQYALLLQKGDSVKKNSEKAAEYYKKAIFMGDIESMNNLSIMFKDGSLPVDLDESRRYSKMAADLGNDKGMFNYGMILFSMAMDSEYDNMNTKELLENAAEYFKKAADMGNIEAGTQYGILCSKRSLSIYNMDDAIRYLENSAFKGSFDGIVEYGSILVLHKEEEEQFKSKFTFLLDYLKTNRYDVKNMLLKFNVKIILNIAMDEMIEKNILRYKKTEFDINKFKFDDFNKEINQCIKSKLDINTIFDLISETCVDYEIPNEITASMINVIKMRLSDNIDFSNDKENNPKDNITLDDIPIMIQNFISKKFKIEINSLIPKTINKNINDVKIKTYKSFNFINDKSSYGILSNSSIPEQIRNEITVVLKKHFQIECSKEKYCHPLHPNDIYSMFVFPDFEFADIYDCVTKKVMEINGIETLNINYFSHMNEERLFFNESLFPENELLILFNFLKTIPFIKNIQRNLFNGNQITTVLTIQNNKLKDVFNSIRDFLTNREILFKTFNYPLLNDIVINEKMVLEDPNDFYVILKEIESVVKPINVERDKLYIYDYNHYFKLFQRFSFICFKDEKDKMKAVNHINSIVFKNKKNVLKYETNLFYASINELLYPERIREQIPKLFQMFKGVEDIQRSVLSFENMVEKTYIGFDSIKHLKKCHYKMKKRFEILLKWPKAKLFWRNKELKYLYIKSPKSLMLLIHYFKNEFDFISKFVEDIQSDCVDTDENEMIFYVSYLGFESLDEAKKALAILSKNPMSKMLDIGIYKEGKSFINITDQSKEGYLFYDCF